jgi:hypothetical protein
MLKEASSFDFDPAIIPKTQRALHIPNRCLSPTRPQRNGA